MEPTIERTITTQSQLNQISSQILTRLRDAESSIKEVESTMGLSENKYSLKAVICADIDKKLQKLNYKLGT